MRSAGAVPAPGAPEGGASSRPVTKRRPLLRWIIPALLGVIIVGPVVSDVVQALDSGWRPIGDNAVILRRALDVGTAQNPLLGMPTSFLVWSDIEAYHPGPLVFWLFAPTTRIFGAGGTSSLFVVALVRIVSAFGIIAIPARLGGRRLAIPAGIALALALSFGRPPLFEPLNPEVAGVPFALLPFLCWAALCGRRWAVPTSVLVASFVTQADLAFVPATGVLMGVLAVLALLRLRTGGRAWLRRNARLIGVTAGVLVVAWSLPAADALSHGGGNVSAIIEGTLSSTIPSKGPGGIVGGTAPVLLLAALGATCWWARRPQRVDRAITPIAAASLVGLAATLWLRPVTGELSGSHAVLGPRIFLLFTVLGAVAGVVRTRTAIPQTALTAGAIVLLAACAVTPTIYPTALPNTASSSAPAALAAEAAEALHEQGIDEVIIRTPGAYPVRDIAISTAVELEGRGIRAYVADGLVPYFGADRDAALVPGAPELWIVDDRAPAPPVPDADRVARWDPTPAELAETAALDESIRDTVASSGGLDLQEGATSLLPRILTGWPEVEAQHEADPTSLRTAPPAVLESLYATDLVAGPALPYATAIELDEQRAAHPIGAYLTT